MYDGAGLTELEPAESLALLRDAPLGRIVFTEDALPAVHPVPFLLHDDTVVVRTIAGAKLIPATDGVVVAFQADDIDRETRQGWSVTVVGHARAVTDQGEREEMDALPFPGGPAEQRTAYIRIQIQHVSGRRMRYLPANDMSPPLSAG